MSSNLVTLNQTGKVAALDHAIQSSIKSVNLLAQRDPTKVQGYIQAFLSEFARKPELHACTDASVLNAFMFSIQIGLKVGGPRPQAALIDYKRSQKGSDGNWFDIHEMQLQPMYPGLNKLMYETGIVESVNNELILTDGTNTEKHSIEGGTNPKISHSLDLGIRKAVSLHCMPNPPQDALERFTIAAYTVIKLKTGGMLTVTPLDTGYLMRIRQTSKGAYRFEKGRNGEPDKLIPNLKHPWFVWWEKMAKKSSLISASKELPAVDNTDQLFSAIRFDELQTVGEMKPAEIAEELGVQGIISDQPSNQFVSAGIPATETQKAETAEPPTEQPTKTPKAKTAIPPELRVLKVKLIGVMSKTGITAAPDQAEVFKAIIGEDAKLNASSAEAAQFLIETASDTWKKLVAKYNDLAPEAAADATGGICYTLVDVIVHGKSDAIRSLVA